jgi:hypothetical protein
VVNEPISETTEHTSGEVTVAVRSDDDEIGTISVGQLDESPRARVGFEDNTNVLNVCGAKRLGPRCAQVTFELASPRPHRVEGEVATEFAVVGQNVRGYYVGVRLRRHRRGPLERTHGAVGPVDADEDARERRHSDLAHVVNCRACARR